jgi:hypothetical protein
MRFKIILLFAVFVIPAFIRCSKDNPDGPPENPEPDTHVVPSPAFQSADSIILLDENHSTFSIKITAIDTLEYYYSTDGTVPGRNSSQYDTATGIVTGEGQFTIQVIAYYQSDSSNITLRIFIVSYLAPVTLSGIKNKTNYQEPVTISISNRRDALQYTSKLNSEVIDLSAPITVSEPGFYTLAITSKLENHERADTFLFVIFDPTRYETEWGLRTWVPAPFEESEITTEVLEAVYPKNYTTGINLPVILKTTESGVIRPLYLSVSNSLTSDIFNIKRGIGSINILPAGTVSSIAFACGNKNINLPITFEDATWTILNGTTGNLHTGKNARIHLNANLTIAAGDTLVIEEGSIIAVNEAVDINNYGIVKITGTSENPVVITCYKPDGYWGGFISKGSGNTLNVSHAILCQSGYHTSAEYQWGHAMRQALFYLEGTDFKISDSYMPDHIGQVFYSTDATIQMDDILVQRAKTSGQLNTSQVRIDRSIFTDFPDDSYEFRDEDNDALYISHCDATVTNSVFMFAKDDGIDSGGDEGGIVNIDNCRFEATFHEGIALSSKNPASRTHNISNCVVTNCGQGIELGFSSPYHTVNIDNCLIYKNGIGLRFGDNYSWSIVDGKMNIKNTRSVNNLNKDIWNMVHQIWSPKPDHMLFTNTFVSKPSGQYPGLPLLPDFDDYPE